MQNFKNKPYLEAANNYEPIQSTSKMVGNLFSFLCRRFSPKRVYRKKKKNTGTDNINVVENEGDGDEDIMMNQETREDTIDRIISSQDNNNKHT